MSLAATYVDQDTFTIATNLTSTFMTGRRIRASCGSDGYKYGTILSSSYSSPNTTVNLTASSDNLTPNLTAVEYGIIGEGSNQSLPKHDHFGDEGDGGEVSMLVGGEVRLTPKSSSTGPKGTIFYDSDDNHVWVATE